MKFSLYTTSDQQPVIALFTDVFSESEGPAEGKMIGELVSNLVSTTEPQDLIGCVATDDERIVGCIFFSRFSVPTDQLSFILSPVAVATDVQGTGIGQRLISYGLEYLKTCGVSLVFTYGNPDYYSKTHFEKISEKQVPAPFPLSQPHGWLAQTLDGSSIESMSGATQCVQAFNDPKYW